MGGRIWVESRTGEGSAFHFTVDLCPAPASALPDAEDAPCVAGLRALVVDDNATNRRILRRTLERNGASVVECEGPESALVLLSGDRTAFDVILLDCMMPGMDGFELARAIRKRELAEGTPLVMLSSAGNFGGALVHGQELAAYLTKPIRPDELMSALGRLTGGAKPKPSSTAGQSPKAQTVRSLCVLLAEDNAVNAQLCVRLLQRYGCTVRTAENGAIAARMAAEGGIDLVLMDVQMPDINGFEATRLIREAERPGERLPIIALTAHAMTGDRERCLAAGMDDYLSKPLERKALEEALLRWGGGVAEPVASLAPDPVPVAAVVRFDRNRFLDVTDGDEELIRELIEAFRDQAAEAIPQLEDLLRKGDPEAIRRLAHTLRGSAGTLGLIEMAETCQRLEGAAADRDGSAVTLLGPEVLTATERALTALEREIPRQTRLGAR
jgi:CheY-like chemotaxis protein